LFGLNRKVQKETIQNKGLCIIKALEIFDNFVHFHIEMQSLKDFPQKLGRILVDSDSDESEISRKIN